MKITQDSIYQIYIKIIKNIFFKYFKSLYLPFYRILPVTFSRSYKIISNTSQDKKKWKSCEWNWNFWNYLL